MSKITLSYFPFAGRGHCIRMAFFVRGIAYDEDFITFKQWGEMKKSGNVEWTGLPMLTITDSKSGNKIDRFGQSNALLRFAGCYNAVNKNDDSKENENSLYPKNNPIDCMYIDQILDACEDLSNSLKYMGMAKDNDAKKAKREEMWQSQWKPFFGKFNEKLERNAKKNDNKEAKYFVGNEMTIADLKFYVSLKTWVDGDIDYIDGKFINEKEFSCLKSFYQNMENNEKIKQFYKQFDEKLAKFKESQK